MILDRDVLAFYVARFIEAFAERGGNAHGAVGRPTADKRDHWHCRPLGARGKRPRGYRTSNSLDELAPPHSIASSAVASSSGGMLRPNALAVLRLMTNSNLADSTTGRSAGF